LFLLYGVVQNTAHVSSVFSRQFVPPLFKLQKDGILGANGKYRENNRSPDYAEYLM
jgi:hypothetical protein